MSPPARRIVCSRPLPDREQHDRLCELGETVVATGSQDFARALREADAAVVIRPTRLGEQEIAAATRLRVVATVSSGVDHVDAAALARHGIALVSGSAIAPHAVAEWTTWAMLGVRRGLAEFATSFAAGDTEWSSRLVGHAGRTLSGASVGIVGFGNVGRLVARMLAPFEPQLVAFDDATPVLGAGCERAASLNELCDRSEVVTLHVPLSSSTRGMIGAEQLRRIGPSGALINAARGELVDPDALLAALRTGELGAAALDCYDPEPPPERYVAALVATGRVLLTPHVAGVSVEALTALARAAVDGIESVIRQERA